MLLSNFNLRLSNLCDTYVQEKVLTCGDQRRGFSLEALTTKYLGKKYQKSQQLDLFSDNSLIENGVFLSKSTRDQFRFINDRFFDYGEIIYGAKDVEHTYKIFEKQLSIAIKNELWRTFSVENMFAIVVAQMEYNGIPIDLDLWVNLAHSNQSKLKVLKTQLIELISSHEDPNMVEFRNLIASTDLFGDQNLDFNLSSSKQMILLCKALGIDTTVVDNKKGSRDSVEKKYLKKYKSNPIIAAYLKYTELGKLVSTYGEAFLNHVNPVTGKIHSSFDQIMATGRISSGTPNVQNIPRSSDFRSCFRPLNG